LLSGDDRVVLSPVRGRNEIGVPTPSGWAVCPCSLYPYATCAPTSLYTPHTATLCHHATNHHFRVVTALNRRIACHCQWSVTNPASEPIQPVPQMQ